MTAKNYDGKILDTFYPKLQQAFDLTALSYKVISLITTTAFRFQCESDPVKYCLTTADSSSATAGAILNFDTSACMYAIRSSFGIDDGFNFITFYNPSSNLVRIYSEKM